MFWSVWIGLLALMLRGVVAATAYRDPDTGLTFASEYKDYRLPDKRIIYRVAVASDAQKDQPFDIIIQIVAPNDVGWTGLAFAGQMPQNPLLIIWRNSTGNGVVVTTRWARGRVTPEPYTGMSYTLYKTGTKVNGTHFQATLKCTGCTSWMQTNGQMKYLKPSDSNRIAMAYSPSKPSNPNSNTSAIPVHEVHAYWEHPFNQGANTNFGQVLQTLQ